MTDRNGTHFNLKKNPLHSNVLKNRGSLHFDPPHNYALSALLRPNWLSNNKDVKKEHTSIENKKSKIHVFRT